MGFCVRIDLTASDGAAIGLFGQRHQAMRGATGLSAQTAIRSTARFRLARFHEPLCLCGQSHPRARLACSNERFTETECDGKLAVECSVLYQQRQARSGRFPKDFGKQLNNKVFLQQPSFWPHI